MFRETDNDNAAEVEPIEDRGEADKDAPEAGANSVPLDFKDAKEPMFLTPPNPQRKLKIALRNAQERVPGIDWKEIFECYVDDGDSEVNILVNKFINNKPL